MPTPGPTCRFAPSPNGPLHLGHAYSALRNAAVADRSGGRLLLRMENIDLTRCRPAFEAAILDDLGWLGLAWERPVRRQSEHFHRYAQGLADLAGMDVVYPCFCTRGDIAAAVRDRPNWPRDPDGAPLYPGTCRSLGPTQRARRFADGAPHAMRLDVTRALASGVGRLGWEEFGEGELARYEAADPAAWGDAVLRRKDIPTSYHVAVVIDDAEQGVTDVVRGLDLFAATSLHRLLQALLRLPAPRYHHHRLVLDHHGAKLSKSRHAPALRELRDAGIDRRGVVRLIEARLA